LLQEETFRRDVIRPQLIEGLAGLGLVGEQQQQQQQQQENAQEGGDKQGQEGAEKQDGV